MNRWRLTGAGLNTVMGLWIQISGWVLGLSMLSDEFWNNMIVGLLIVAASATRVTQPRVRSPVRWFPMGFGLWLMASPFVLGMSTSGLFVWNQVLGGLTVSLLGWWDANSRNMASSDPESRILEKFPHPP